MDVAGTFTLDIPREKVWVLIRDPAVMAECMPGCTGIEVVSPTSYKAGVKVGLGPLKMLFNVLVEVVEERAPELIRSTTSGDEGGRASFISSQNRLELKEIDANTTEVAYAASVSIAGRLGKFGLGMMRKKTDSIAAEFGRNFTEYAKAHSA